MDYTSSVDLTIPATVPRQKISTSAKTPDWCKQNSLYWENRLINKNTFNESDKIKMKRNCNLYYHGVLDPIEVGKICNPYNLKDFKIPLDFKHYKIENPKIQTLKGEELKRRFEWKVYISNRDAISEKEEQKKQQFSQFITDQIKSKSADPQEVQSKLQKLQDYLNYDWQEIRELTCDQLLHHFNQYLDLKTIFSRAWEHGMLNAEELISVDEHNGKPVVDACDPKTTYWLSSPENPYIDDSDAVVRCYYMPLGQVIDYYYEFLTPIEISELEERQAERSSEQDFTLDQYYHKSDDGFFIPNKVTGDLIVVNDRFRGYYDLNGNIRVVHTRWKSLRKVGELSYFDENGDEQTKYVDENYKADKTTGESIKWLWISEAWENTRIGEDIFIKGKPRSVQFRQLDNISHCSLGYIGTRLDNGLFDVMKDYSIKYDAYMYRTEQAMIKAMGKIGKLDLALIPDDWDIDMWMHFATNMGWAVIDTFKEGKKGAAQGKLAGSGGTQGDVINMEQGQFIQQNMMMLQYLEGQLDKIVGINSQRQGMISQDAGLQVTREAQQASSNITESYFAIHDNIKLRTLRALLEVAKYCLKNKVESIQYITSEMVSQIFNIDGDQINEADYGILVGDATNDARTITTLQEAVKIALQTGAVDLIQLMDIFSTDSTSSIKRKIEKSVNAKKEQEQANIEAEQKDKQAQRDHLYQMQQEQLDLEKEKMDLKRYEVDENNRTKLEIAEMTAYALDKAPVEDIGNTADLALKAQAEANKNFQENQKLQHEKDKHESEKRFKKEELELEKAKLEALKKDTIIRANAEKAGIAADKEIAKLKAKTDIQKARLKPKGKAK